MRNKILTLVVVFSLLCCSETLLAKERRGAELAVQKLDGQQVRGELIAVKQDSLLLLDSSTATDVSIDTLDIKTIKVVKKSKTVLGVGLGLVIGGAVGALAGYGGSHLFWHSEERQTWAWMGGVVGLVSGALIGIALSGPETIQVEGKSAAETKDILMKLRSKARIVNLQ
jgi:hypothetical protein